MAGNLLIFTCFVRCVARVRFHFQLIIAQKRGNGAHDKESVDERWIASRRTLLQRHLRREIATVDVALRLELTSLAGAWPLREAHAAAAGASLPEAAEPVCPWFPRCQWGWRWLQ